MMILVRVKSNKNVTEGGQFPQMKMLLGTDTLLSQNR